MPTTQTPATKRLNEQQLYLESLREHGRVIEADSDSVPLPAGVTHVLVKKNGAKPKLVEKRKSYF